MTTFTSLPGFRDFYPADFALRAHIAGAWREAARRYAIEEYDGPPLEPLELYVQKSGEEIVRQLYNFQDKGGRDVTLRPEMTPTLARMIGARARAMPKPVRWFSIPQLFRYERTQRGRLREHFQWNVDIVGEADIGADAEVLAVGLDGLRLLGLTAEDIVARVSDRRLLERLLRHTGVPVDQLPAAYMLIDKLGREDDERLRQRLGDEAGLDRATVEAIFEIFAHPGLEALAAAYGDVKGVPAELDRLSRYFAHLNDMGLGDYVVFDPTIVRGLAYYTGIVFEIFDREAELRAICGGGRYDHLLRAVSDVDLPALGFGMGDVVIAELLARRGLAPDYAARLDYWVVAVGEPQRPVARRIAHRLRDAGYSVAYTLRPTGVGRQFKDADGRGADRAIVLGPDELSAGAVLIRELRTGQERRVPLDELIP